MKARMKCRQKFCPSWACNHDTCICRHDSPVDVETLDCSKGNKKFILLYRAYHREHPHVTTMQDVRLRVARNGKGGKGGRGRGGGRRGGDGRGGGGAGVSMISMRDMLAHTGTGDEFEAWLAEADCAGPGLSVLADADDSIEFELAVAESDAVPLSTDVAARGDDASAPAAPQSRAEAAGAPP